MKQANIVVILTDDQRFDTIQALGNKDISTPNFDKLVDRGFTFDHAHIMGGTIGAVCSPSRNMLMTGRSLFHIFGDEIADKGPIISPDHITMPQHFGDNGYQTYHVGKWHQDREAFNRSFADGASIFGFHQPGPGYCGNGGHCSIMLHDYDQTGGYESENLYLLNEAREKMPVTVGGGGVHSTEIFADSAVDFLENKREEDKPFFLYVAFVAPHDPRESPNEFEAMYEAGDIEVPKNFMPRHPFDNGELTIRDEMLEGFPRREHAVCRHLADYYGMISHLDQQIGRIFDAIDDIGEKNNTIIVFAGDNGLALGQHGLMGKQSLYDHSVRVPLILAGPNIPQGVRSENLCYLLDIYPSLCEMTGQTIPKSVEGVSFKEVIDGTKDQSRDHLFCGYREFQRSVRNERYKLIRYEVNGETIVQLFDMTEDPLECNNLYENVDYKDVLGALTVQLEADIKEWDFHKD